jgi:hypothetical protein
MPSSTQNIMETLQPSNTTTSEEPSLRVQVLRKNASKKTNTDAETTRMRVDKKAVHNILSRLKRPRPCTDAQAFVEVTNESRPRP